MKREYTAEEVKQMADERGLPCRIQKSNGVTTIQPIATLETLGLVRVWSKFWNKQALAEDSFDRIARSSPLWLKTAAE